MAATPKHKRSSSKARSTRASNRYDVVTNRARTIKRKGGSFFSISKETGLPTLSHRVTKEDPNYRGKKVIND